MDRKTWLAERRKGLGGSDAPVIMGASPYKTLLDLYEDKVYGVEHACGLDAEVGTELESFIATLYTRQTGYPLRRSTPLRRHKTYKWMMGNADRLVKGQARGVEIKFIGPSRAAQVLASRECALPEHIWQCRHYMMVFDMPIWDLCMLLVTNHGCELKIVTIERDPDIETGLFIAAQNFWHKHVLAKVPPPPQSPEEHARLLQALYPMQRADGKMLTWADESQGARLLAELREASSACDAADLRYVAACNAIKAQLGDASGAECGVGRVRWTTGKERKYIQWERIARHFLGALHAQDAEDFIRRNTELRAGTRVFRFTPAGSMEEPDSEC